MPAWPRRSGRASGSAPRKTCARCSVSVDTLNGALGMVRARGIVRDKPGSGNGLFVDTHSSMVRFGNSMLALDRDAASVADAVRLRGVIDPLRVAHVSPTPILCSHYNSLLGLVESYLLSVQPG